MRSLIFGLGAAVIVTGSTPAQRPTGPDGVSITFLANEGVMLSSGDKKVLIDGLFLKYGPPYAVPADSTQAALRAARAPFDAVDLILVTHRHGDHFHPDPVADHLRANPRALLLTSRQVIDSLRGRISATDPLTSRLMARTTPPGRRRREVVNGINVELLGLPHGYWKNRWIVEHLGYIVDLGGRRVLHVGDVSDDEETFTSFRLDTARIDVALVPDWMLTSEKGRRTIERWIRPKHIVAIHLAEGAPVAEARAALPGAVVFSRSLETIRR